MTQAGCDIDSKAKYNVFLGNDTLELPMNCYTLTPLSSLLVQVVLIFKLET